MLTLGKTVLEEDKKMERNSTNECGDNGVKQEERGNRKMKKIQGKKSHFAAVAKPSHEESIKQKSNMSRQEGDVNIWLQRNNKNDISLLWRIGSQGVMVLLDGFMRDAVQQKLQ